MNRRTNNSNSNSNYPNEQVKIYFPSIPIHVLQNTLHSTPKQNKTQNKNKQELDKYLCSETPKTTIYGTTSILEIHNGEPYSIYPCDKMIITSSIPVSPVSPVSPVCSAKHSQHQLLIDYSSMKRSQTPCCQIPYDFKVHSCLVKKYKMNPKSNTCFVIEYKDNKVYDFYVLAKLSILSIGLSTNRIELDNFIKEDKISFLLMLNLY